MHSSIALHSWPNLRACSLCNSAVGDDIDISLTYDFILTSRVSWLRNNYADCHKNGFHIKARAQEEANESNQRTEKRCEADRTEKRERERAERGRERERERAEGSQMHCIAV